MRQQSRRVGLLVALGVLLAACADPKASSGGTQHPAAPASTQLTITVAATQQGKPQSWTLSCAPTGGTLARASDACAFIAKTPADAVAPVRPNVACSMIFGGPQLGTIKGTWRGKAVNAKFNRTNGCEVARWDNLMPLLGNPA